MTEDKFNPIPPELQTDLKGGRRYEVSNPLPEWQSGEQTVEEAEKDLDVKPGTLTNDDPADPNYQPATARTEKWKRLKETGEV